MSNVVISWSDIYNRYQTKNYCGQEYDVAAFLPISFASHDFESQCQKEFGNWDWSRSFHKTQIIYHDERIVPEMLIAMHGWLRQQAGNIENVVVVTTHTAGLTQWWDQYCSLYNQRSFKIREWPFIRSFNWQDMFVNMKLLDRDIVLEAKKNIEFLFSYYGGISGKHDSMYLTLKMMNQFDVSLIDLVAKFKLSEQQITDYSMYLSYFGDVNEQVEIQNLHKEFVIGNTIRMHDIVKHTPFQKIRCEPFVGAGMQWDVDQRCFANVVRETDNLQPFGILTEKTFRGFYHHMAVVPLGYKTVECLEKYGFWFPHDIIDFDYQHEKDFLTRLNAMIKSLENLKNSHSMSDINEYYKVNFDKFRSNAELCVNYRFSDLHSFQL